MVLLSEVVGNRRVEGLQNSPKQSKTVKNSQKQASATRATTRAKRAVRCLRSAQRFVYEGAPERSEGVTLTRSVCVCVCVGGQKQSKTVKNSQKQSK